MLEDNLGASPKGKRPKKQREEEKILPPMAAFLKTCRSLSIPVIFACDSFLKDDFLFRGRVKPHAIRGTKGVKPLAALDPQESDIILEDLSAAYKREIHRNCLDAYRNSALYPILRVMNSRDFLNALPS